MKRAVDTDQPLDEDALTLEELSDALADGTGITHEEIERGAEEMEIAAPSEATVVYE